MKKGLQTTILLILATVSFTIVFIVFHQSRQENASTYTMDRTEKPLESETSGCAIDWGLTGDHVCDDETNTEECHFDLGDCCDGQNDFSLCSDCFCYSAGHNINDCPWQTQSPHHRFYYGDGICQHPQLNNIQNLFDLGDCCLESPICEEVLDHSDWESHYWGPSLVSWSINCPENVCIKSDVHCIEEFKGDGICDEINNSPFCEFDLGDCSPYALLSYSCE